MPLLVRRRMRMDQIVTGATEQIAFFRLSDDCRPALADNTRDVGNLALRVAVMEFEAFGDATAHADAAE